jgi:hypothetical protein
MSWLARVNHPFPSPKKIHQPGDTVQEDQGDGPHDLVLASDSHVPIFGKMAKKSNNGYRTDVKWLNMNCPKSKNNRATRVMNPPDVLDE